MPNWATNDVEVFGTKDALEKLMADATKGTFQRFDYSSWNKETKEYEKFEVLPNRFSFDAVVPTPANLKSGKTFVAGGDNSEANESFANAIKGDLDYDYDNAYDWHLAHWGTKWDIDQDTLGVTEITQGSDGTYHFGLGFNTAWSPACQFWTTVSEKYGVRVVNHYYEEGMNFIGTFEVDCGEVLNDACLNISKKMYEIAGAVFDEEGEVDFSESDIDLSVLFPITIGD